MSKKTLLIAGGAVFAVVVFLGITFVFSVASNQLRGERQARVLYFASRSTLRITDVSSPDFATVGIKRGWREDQVREQMRLVQFTEQNSSKYDSGQVEHLVYERLYRAGTGTTSDPVHIAEVIWVTFDPDGRATHIRRTVHSRDRTIARTEDFTLPQ